MTESRFLDKMETPRELTRARRKEWSKFALIVAACTLAFAGLEVLYTSPLLPMLGLRVTLRPYWHYITAVPVVIAATWFASMLITAPIFRLQRARTQRLMDLEHPDVLAQSMRRRYERTAQNVKALEKVIVDHRRRFIKTMALTLLFALLTVGLFFLPRVLEMGVEVDITSFLVTMGPYVLGLISFSCFGEAFKSMNAWIESRVKIRDHLELKQDLAASRRELHGEVAGALTATAARRDGSGDLSLTGRDS